MKRPSLPQVIRNSPLATMGVLEIGAIVAVFVGAALILGFGLLANEVVEGDTRSLDMSVIMAFRTAGNPSDLLGPPWVEEMGRDITALGSYAFIVITVACSIGYLLMIRKYALAAVLAAAELGGMLISNLLKAGFDRPRPDIDHAARVFTASFPSGHATLSAVTFLTLGALLTRTNADRRVKVYFLGVALFLTFIVGASRVYLGVHYPSDVLAGWCTGSAWAVLCWAAALWLQRRGKVERAAG